MVDPLAVDPQSKTHYLQCQPAPNNLFCGRWQRMPCAPGTIFDVNSQVPYLYSKEPRKEVNSQKIPIKILFIGLRLGQLQPAGWSPHSRSLRRHPSSPEQPVQLYRRCSDRQLQPELPVPRPVRLPGRPEFRPAVHGLLLLPQEVPPCLNLQI